MLRVDVAHAGYNAKGMLWRVENEGRTIIEKTRLPAFDACRHLQALGATGKLAMYRNGQSRRKSGRRVG
jgi:hypothetical protein